MNNVLELKGNRFVQSSKPGTGGGVSMNGKVTVTFDKINDMIKKLKSIKNNSGKTKVDHLAVF